MGTWGMKTFENDDSLDFIGGIYEEHKDNKGKDDFLFKDLKGYLKEISTSEFLKQEFSIGIEVSSYIFSELINYDEKRINKSLDELKEEIEEECEGGYKLDLSKPIFQIINEVEEKDGFIPSEMYIDLCLYKNKNYNIGETFLYRLIRQLHNIISGNSENYEIWEQSSEEDFQEWLKYNENIFKKLQKGLKDENNIRKAKNLDKLKQPFLRDGLKGFKFFNKEGKLIKIVLKSDSKKIEERYKNEELIKKEIFEKYKGYFRIKETIKYKRGEIILKHIEDYTKIDLEREEREKSYKQKEESRKKAKIKYEKEKNNKPYFNKLTIFKYRLKGLDLNLLLTILIKDISISKIEFNKLIKTIEFIKNKNDLNILKEIKKNFNEFYLNRLLRVFANFEEYFIKQNNNLYKICIETNSYIQEAKDFLTQYEKDDILFEKINN